jgi:D-tyrosyl-tRNA(Tyr) deacylase
VRALIQRVSEAAVHVDGALVGRIGPGLLILVCAVAGDDETRPEPLARKIAKLRVFRDEADKMNLSLLDTGGAALVVSQFTLAADTSRGNRPGFSGAADPGTGRQLYEAFIASLRELGIATKTGQFGADMKVSLINDGPVTMMIDN